MATRSRAYMKSARIRIATWFTGPQVLAFVPALCLGAFWLGGESALMLVALGLPLVVLSVNPQALRAQSAMARRVRGLVPRSDFAEVIEEISLSAREQGRNSVVMVLEINDLDPMVERYGQAAAEQIIRRIGERFDGLLREKDAVSQVGDCRFAVCLQPVQIMDLETCIQLAGRLQTSVEEPVLLEGATVYTTASIGFCMLSRAPGATGQAWLEAAEIALTEARRRGPTAIRAYSNEMRKIAAERNSMRDQVQEALEAGHIQPWFQPQISTDTGRISGFEALARWTHPEKGIIPPGEFLPVLEDAGLLDRLGEVMLYHSLTALKAWDAAGEHVPCVGVNFSDAELNNPRLIEKVRWELDRFELGGDRLAVEILETVVSSGPGDAVSRNVNALAELGCKIDLDDFGTGNASIAAIRRFNVSRIKIDRSFVAKSDRDEDQRMIVSAILSLSERLDIETLAEGVETVGEHALLAQLGCDHVQGFGIGRPMPFDKTMEWMAQHNAKLKDTPTLPKRSASK